MKVKKHVSKQNRMMVLTFIIGTIFSIFLYGFNKRQERIVDGYTLSRNEWSEGAYDILINVSDSEYEKNISLNIPERKYTESELCSKSDEVIDILGRKILNGNISTEYITDNMYLPLKVNGFPFSLRWVSSNEDIINNTGMLLCKKSCKEEHIVDLKVILIYEKYRYEHIFKIRIVPKKYTVSEETFITLENEIDKSLSDETQKNIILPKNVNGNELTYKEVQTNSSIVMFLVTIFMTIIIGIAVQYDEKIKQKKYTDQMMELYPAFVERLKLYMVSGLSLKNSIFVMRDNLKSLNSNKYKQLIHILENACNKYINGFSEEMIVNDFGRRCGGNYKKLSFLLAINLKQGSDRILVLLNEEVDNALQKRKENAKRKGDEAAVSLLFPMIIMMLIVMIIIIFPAYYNFE